jgi:hypothetical protein
MSREVSSAQMETAGARGLLRKSRRTFNERSSCKSRGSLNANLGAERNKMYQSSMYCSMPGASRLEADPSWEHDDPAQALSTLEELPCRCNFLHQLQFNEQKLGQEEIPGRACDVD